MSRFVELISINPQLRRIQIAKDLGFSSSTSQRCRHDIKLQSPYRSNDPKELRKLQMTSKQAANETGKNVFKKGKLKGGGNIEFNDEYLIEFNTTI